MARKVRVCMAASKQGVILTNKSLPLKELPACMLRAQTSADQCASPRHVPQPLPRLKTLPRPPYSVTPGTPPAASSAALAPTGGGGAVCSTAWSGRAICSRRVGLTCKRMPSKVNHGAGCILAALRGEPGCLRPLPGALPACAAGAHKHLEHGRRCGALALSLKPLCLSVLCIVVMCLLTRATPSSLVGFVFRHRRRVRTGTSAVRVGAPRSGSPKRAAGRTPVSPPAGTAARRNAGLAVVPAAAAAAAAAAPLAASARVTVDDVRRMPRTLAVLASRGLAAAAGPAAADARLGVRAPSASTANAVARPRAPATGVLYGWLTSAKYCARGGKALLRLWEPVMGHTRPVCHARAKQSMAACA